MPKREETVRVHGLETGYKGKNGDVAVTRGVDASLYSGELTCLFRPLTAQGSLRCLKLSRHSYPR